MFALRPAPHLSLTLFCILRVDLYKPAAFPRPQCYSVCKWIKLVRGNDGRKEGVKGRGQGISPRCPLPWAMSPPVGASSWLQLPPDRLCCSPCLHQLNLPQVSGNAGSSFLQWDKTALPPKTSCGSIYCILDVHFSLI